MDAQTEIASLSAQEILNLIETSEMAQDKLLKLIEIFKDRSKTISDMVIHLKSISSVPQTYDCEYLDELVNDNTAYQIEMLIKRLETFESNVWKEEDITELIKTFSKEFDIKIAYLAHIIRLSLIGKSDGPGMYKMLSVLDREDIIKRLKKFRSHIL